MKKVVKKLGEDTSLEVRPEFDKDTLGKLGSPDILKTIKEKIANCGVLVADLSIIGETNGKKIVNQNVMFEIGYMIGSNSEDRLILLFNEDLGELKSAPFDIAHHRVTSFSIKRDPGGETFESLLLQILKLHIQNAKLESKIPKTHQDTLDAVESLMMQLLASMQDDIRIMTARTFEGVEIIPVSPCDKSLLAKVNEGTGGQRAQAALDSLVDKKILSVFHGSKGTPNYQPTNTGFKIIDDIKQK